MKSNDVKKSLVVKTYLFLFALLVLSACLIYIDTYARQTMPPAYEIKPESDAGYFLTFSDFQDLKIAKSAAYCEADAQIDDGTLSHYDIKAVLTNGKYADIYAMDMVAGSFFDDKMVSKQFRYAVISDKLSKELYTNSNSIGNFVYIDDSKYTVIGVYKDQDSFWAQISRDRYDRIYIPYTTSPDYRNTKLDALAVTNDQQKTGVHKLMIEHPELTGSNINIDYGTKLRYCTQFPEIVKFTAKVIVLLFILLLLYKIMHSVCMAFLKQHKDYYPWEILKNNVRKMVCAFLATSLLVYTAFFLAKSLKFPIYIPGSILPNENLFDLRHYMDMITSFFTRDNSMFLPGNNFYYLLANKTLSAQIVISVLIFLFLFLLLGSFRRLANDKQILAVELVGYLGIALLLSFMLKLCTKDLFFSGFSSIMLYYAALLVGAIVYERSIKYLSKFNLE